MMFFLHMEKYLPRWAIRPSRSTRYSMSGMKKLCSTVMCWMLFSMVSLTCGQNKHSSRLRASPDQVSSESTSDSISDNRCSTLQYASLLQWKSFCYKLTTSWWQSKTILTKHCVAEGVMITILLQLHLLFLFFFHGHFSQPIWIRPVPPKGNLW